MFQCQIQSRLNELQDGYDFKMLKQKQKQKQEIK